MDLLFPPLIVRPAFSVNLLCPDLSTSIHSMQCIAYNQGVRMSSSSRYHETRCALRSGLLRRVSALEMQKRLLRSLTRLRSRQALKHWKESASGTQPWSRNMSIGCLLTCADSTVWSSYTGFCRPRLVWGRSRNSAYFSTNPFWSLYASWSIRYFNSDLRATQSG